jgi:hypothetical protein
MRLSLIRALAVLLIAAAIIPANRAGAAQIAANDACSLYGYARGTRDYAACRVNARHYWSTGPCNDSRFASIHRRYCHLIPTFDF